MEQERPKLRYLEALPCEQDGKRLIALRDPAQISPHVLALPPQLHSLVALFDGRHSLLDIQAEVSRSQNGELILREDLQRIVDQLDQVFFLDNDNFRKRREELLAEFHAQPVRPAYHASVSYPAQSNQLAERLSSFYLDPKGAGLPRQRSGQALRALVAPHIDLRLGGTTYTHAYRQLAESEPADLYVILGTGHMGLPELFSISPKNFETPLGTAETDQEFLRLFRERVPEPLFQEDLTHRHEHTVEFQVVFLQHLFAGRPIKILPVLCSFSCWDVDPGSSSATGLFWKWAEAFREAERKSGKKITLIASVDLAHIGPRYGDSFRPDGAVVEEVSRKDRQMLEHVCSGQGDDFRDFVKEEQDQRRICGFSPLYTLLQVLDGQKGILLEHDHSTMDELGSFVTYTSMVVRDE